MPVKPTEFCIDEARKGRVFVRQGRLSRHKVSVGEPAEGSPPKNLYGNTIANETNWARSSIGRARALQA